MKKMIGVDDKIIPWNLQPYELYEYGLDLGLKSEYMLDAIGLSEELIEDIDLRINWHQFHALARRIDRTNPGCWGFELGKRLSLSSHGLLSLAIMNSANWSQIGEVVFQYMVLINPIFYVETRHSEQHFYLTLLPDIIRTPYQDKFSECIFTAMYQTARDTGGLDFDSIPDGICVLMKGPSPDYSDNMREYFDQRIQWNNHAYQIKINKGLVNLDTPLVANPIAAKTATRTLEAQLNRLKASKGCLRELRGLFRQGIFSQDSCADKLITSTPTLKRYLRSAATSFSQELKQYRIEEACWLLKTSDSSVTELSEQLGFEDTGSFRRMFKAETGLTPSDYRHFEIQQSL